jgi:hypothetical protein
MPDEFADRDGSYVPFARTETERQSNGDERPSLEMRYRSQDDYIAQVQACVDALVAERLLLPADAEAYVTAAKASQAFRPATLSSAAAK